MAVSNTNTTGTSDISLVAYALGKHNWTIEKDKSCNNGKPYSIQLKLTGCRGGETSATFGFQRFFIETTKTIFTHCLR